MFDNLKQRRREKKQSTNKKKKEITPKKTGTNTLTPFIRIHQIHLEIVDQPDPARLLL